MLRGISDLRRFTIAATDGNLGSVGDVYFDDRSWSVRYLVVNAGSWFPGRRVLVSPNAVRTSDPTTLDVALSKQQVAAGPDVNARGLPGSSTQQGGVEPASLARAGESGGVHLRTATAVVGYAIRTEDGHRESVGGQEGVGVTGVAHPRDVGRIEDALLYRHGGRRHYREREGSDSIDRASADCRTSIPRFERASSRADTLVATNPPA